ncbi:spore germination protein [Neobacillus drentensis]|uniref:spore germination protein n=1 Tax=Neobacillus drentensis TaxID=220684 RepID=UPI002FFED6EA
MSVVPFPVKIDIVSGGIVQFGPSVFFSPKSASKTNSGSGADNLGVLVNTVTGVSTTNTIDSDVLDQPIVKDI